MKRLRDLPTKELSELLEVPARQAHEYLEAADSILDLTPVGRQTTVSDVKADEGSPHDAGSDTELPARVQTRSCSPGSLLANQECRPDSQGAWRLGQFVEELGQADRDRCRRAGRADHR